MAKNLTNQVRSIAEVMKAVAGGDLTKKIEVDERALPPSQHPSSIPFSHMSQLRRRRLSISSFNFLRSKLVDLHSTSRTPHQPRCRRGESIIHYFCMGAKFDQTAESICGSKSVAGD